MNREYLRWYSPRLHRDMEMLAFGHAGAKVLMYPTRDGRFWEYETLGVVDALSEKVRAGHLHLFCIEGLARETFYDKGRHPTDRLRRHRAHEEYVLNEVLPLMADRNPDGATIVQGCSLGAYQAASLVFRHPHLFDKLAAFSGRYDLTLGVESFTDLFDGHYDEDVYLHMPTHFLPNHPQDGRLDRLRAIDIILAIGDADPFLANNLHLGQILAGKGVHHRLHVWDGRAHRGSAWRKMAALYI
jgi:esterase/lipase superfamily enzyme